MHGHWLKGYLRDGKEIEGGGGGAAGGGVFWLTLTPPPEEGYPRGIAESYNEIRGAVESGKIVALNDTATYEAAMLYLNTMQVMDNTEYGGSVEYEVTLTGSTPGQYRYMASDPDTPMHGVTD